MLLCLITVNHSSWRKSNLKGVFYLHEAEDLCSFLLIMTTSKCKHLLVEISVQRVQLTNIILLNSKGSHHLWLSCMKYVVCWGTKLSSLRHKYIHSFAVNCEYHNSEFSVYSVCQFISNKYICLILPNSVNNCSYFYVPYQRGTSRNGVIANKIQTSLIIQWNIISYMICGNIRGQIICQRLQYLWSVSNCVCVWFPCYLWSVSGFVLLVNLVSKAWQTCYHFSGGRKVFLEVDC